MLLNCFPSVLLENIKIWLSLLINCTLEQQASINNQPPSPKNLNSMEYFCLISMLSSFSIVELSEKSENRSYGILQLRNFVEICKDKTRWEAETSQNQSQSRMYFTSKRISAGLVKFATKPPFSKVQHPCFAITWPPRISSLPFILNTTDTLSLPSLSCNQAEYGERGKIITQHVSEK